MDNPPKPLNDPVSLVFARNAVFSEILICRANGSVDVHKSLTHCLAWLDESLRLLGGGTIEGDMDTVNKIEQRVKRQLLLTFNGVNADGSLEMTATKILTPKEKVEKYLQQQHEKIQTN